MTPEIETLDPQFFKGFQIHWCSLCGCAILSCSHCHGTTCNCHSCPKCEKVFEEFCKRKRYVTDYLSEEERTIFQKIKLLEKLIYENISNSSELDFKELKNQGEFCELAEKLFEKELCSPGHKEDMSATDS